eukprot:CAMPEP_0172516590 /NCGR_PEP_ID=MMETSP1066-20121228/277427_1 /TAXON_ID=671091 /ORGANISM="Coscinodiscus wailesii, Strain CCMP2513" /LENGTH=270 /DNA_ID=CAMNT_0013298143 /DNA_START=208 /DNA_END=1020 /DNA_ORIENTATION=+
MALEFNYDEINRLQKEKKESVDALNVQIEELSQALEFERKMRINLEMELRIAKKGGAAESARPNENDRDDDTRLDGIDVSGWGKNDRSVISFNTAATSASTRSEDKDGIKRASNGSRKSANLKDGDCDEDDEDIDEDMLKQHFSHMTFHELEAALQSKLSQVARLEKKIQKQRDTISEYEEELNVLRKGVNSQGSNDHIVKELVERVNHFKAKLKAKDQEMQEVSDVMTQWVQGKGEEIKKLANMIKIQKDQITALTREIENQKQQNGSR